MKPAPTIDPEFRELADRARELYLRASRDVDTATATRLQVARRTALEAAQSPPRLLRWMMPAGAVAVAALAVVVVWQPMRRTLPTVAPAAVSSTDDDLPPDADSADPALYQNLDFYAWLARQPAPKRQAGG
ncbi:MAG TPA: hypothetical protein VFJ04_08575 [Rhodanobacteraceae bacterium]|jgi:hypothetical protein|nr:hypothetical protein [Rhodanobacteraceae bacterium]